MICSIVFLRDCVCSQRFFFLDKQVSSSCVVVSVSCFKFKLYSIGDDTANLWQFTENCYLNRWVRVVVCSVCVFFLTVVHKLIQVESTLAHIFDRIHAYYTKIKKYPFCCGCCQFCVGSFSTAIHRNCLQ